MKRIKKKTIYIIIITLTIILISIPAYSYAKFIGNAAWNYYLESKGFYFESLNLTNSTYLNYNWNNEPIEITIQNYNDELKSTDNTIEYTIECNVINDPTNNLNCNINNTGNSIDYQSIENLQICINKIDNTDVTSLDEETCTSRGYEWSNGKNQRIEYIEITSTDPNQTIEEVEVEITVKSTSPYSKTIKGTFYLVNNTSNPDVTFEHQSFAEYENLILTNNSNKNYIYNITWSTNKLKVAKTDYLNNYTNSENEIYSIDIELNNNTTLIYDFYKENALDNISISDYTITLVRENLAYEDPSIDGADPEISRDLLPVLIANDGTVTKANTDIEWYNYQEKEWANAVIVSNETKNTYYNADNGVVINEDDIIAYYVWIPRFEYMIPYSGTGTGGSARTFNINIVNKDEPKKTSTQQGTYHTHAAFTHNGEELNGFWMAKFELTGTNTTPTIKPNQSSLKEVSISNFHDLSTTFTTTYSINGTSRQMTTENWNAAAYLASSIYGINQEIRINNSSLLTGCGALNENANTTTSCEIKYGEAQSYPQSTTGNITGVFDMSGGYWEYAMTNYNYINHELDGFETLPSEAFMSVYNQSSSTLALDRVNLGLFETFGWNSDIYYIISDTHPWIRRGGDHSSSSGAGAFAMGNAYGNAALNVTARFVIHN